MTGGDGGPAGSRRYVGRKKRETQELPLHKTNAQGWASREIKTERDAGGEESVGGKMSKSFRGRLIFADELLTCG